MARDYFAPVFAIKINGSQLPADVARNFTSVSVDQELGKPDHFSLTIANPYPQMPWTGGDRANLIREGTAIEIDMGYVDHLELKFSGEITSISPSFPESGTPTVQVEGYSRAHWLIGGSKTRTFQNMTDKQIVERIAAEVKLSPKVDPTGDPHPYVIQYNQTDMEFLTQRARGIRFEVLVVNTDLIFRKAEEDETKTYTLVWGHPREEIDLSKNLMPLRSFNPSLNTLQQVSEVIVRGQHPTTNETIEGRAGEGDEDTKMGGTQTGPQVAAQAFGRRKEQIHVDTPILSEQEATSLARAIYNDRALQLVTGTGSTIGLPRMRAGQVVELLGLGKRFDGDYYITRSAHSINSGGYQTTFSVRRNSVG